MTTPINPRQRWSNPDGSLTRYAWEILNGLRDAIGAGTGLAKVSLRDSAATAGPTVILDRDSTSPAASDLIGQIRFDGRDSGGNETVYARLRASIADPASGTEDGALKVVTLQAATETDVMHFRIGAYMQGATDQGAGTFNATGLYVGGAHVYYPGGTDVAVADGGTGASTASGARTNLGVAIGSDVQAWDADLDTLAANITAFGQSLVDDADAATARGTLGLGTIATQDAGSVTITGGSITGITDLAVADGGTGASTAGDARTNLGLGTIATQNANNVSITGGSITGITDLAVADGGTGASTAGDARTNLGLGSIATQNANNVSITGGSVTGITDLAIADGGTGASTASDARTNLGLGTAAVEDYEEGTFTPRIDGLTTAGTGTYAVQTGRYAKIGRMVFAYVSLNWSAHTGTGNMAVAGLPYSAFGNWVPALHHSNIALTAGNTLQGITASGADRITLNQVPTGGGASAAVPIDTAGVLILTLVYEAL